MRILKIHIYKETCSLYSQVYQSTKVVVWVLLKGNLKLIPLNTRNYNLNGDYWVESVYWNLIFPSSQLQSKIFVIHLKKQVWTSIQRLERRSRPDLMYKHMGCSFLGCWDSRSCRINMVSRKSWETLQDWTDSRLEYLRAGKLWSI